MSTKTSVANAVGGKTARACDSCLRKRARWYCAADDAFLCQSCDSAVHSANPLARRHQRLRLNSSPPISPSWLSGFTRKPRTRRPRPPKSDSDDLLVSLVPDEDNTNNNNNNNEEEDSEDLLLYRVPTFVDDPFVVDESASSLFLPSDLDLADFAADVESLLGRNLESECFDMEGIGLGRVKLEEHQHHHHRDALDNYNCRSVPEVQEFEAEVDLMRDVPSFQFDFDHDQKKVAVVGVKNERQQQHQEEYYYCGGGVDENKDEEKKRKVALRLDCDAVIAAWGNDKSPWTTGERPDFQPDEAWPHCMAICGSVSYGQTCGEYGVSAATTTVGDSGREARVSRYREKRRTRLFSKKIRYEVRKLNAEKRPRMKGRFVKRITTPFTLPIITIN